MAPPTEPAERLGATESLLLGLMHGPAEMVPVSSSGHTTLVPWLLGMSVSDLPAERRKGLEVALHVGTAAGLLVFPPASSVPLPRMSRRLALDALTLLPTAAVGLLLRGAITRRLGTPATVAAGLAVGSAALVAADAADGSRSAETLGAADALAIGAAQSAALWPGVSRSAMTILAARRRGFAAADAARISRSGIVPAATAAAALEGAKAASDGSLGRDSAALTAAAAGAFLSTAVSRPLATRLERGGRLTPWAGVRLLTAGLAIRRIRSLGDDASR